MYESVEVVTNALSIVGESPVWDEKKQCLYYVDIHGKRMRTVDWQSGKISDIVLPQQAGCIAQDSNGDIFGGLEDGIYRIGADASLAQMNRPYEMHGPRFNDGKVGPDGNYYVGTYGINSNGALYRMDTDGAMTQLLSGVGNANGLCWDTQKGLFYFNDTPTMKTDVYSFADGEIRNRKTVFTYDNMGNPDGMTIDADGMLWVALWGGYKVVRIDPAKQKIIDETKIPTANAASCTFGGKNMNELIITTSSHMIVLRDEPLAGAVFRVKTSTCGLPFYRFAV